MHRGRVASSQLEDLLPAGPGGGIPSISTARAQAWCRFAQVIHMLMHTAGQQSCCRAGSPQQISAGACVTCPPCRTPGPGVDGIAREGTDARRFTGQAARVSTGCPPVMLILRRGPLERPGRSLSACVTQPRAGTRRGDPVRAPGFRSRSRTSPVPGHDCGPSRWRISGGGGVPRRCQPGHSGRAESGRAPPCMRWRGPARPRRTGWLVARPCWHSAPPAGAGYPCEGPVSRLLPRSRGRPQVVPVSER